jgi:hypothetical protein
VLRDLEGVLAGRLKGVMVLEEYALTDVDVVDS